MRDLPRPITPDQLFMAGVCERLDAQNTLLGEIRDRLGQAPHDETPPAEVTGPTPVELREPDPGPAAPKLAAQPAELAEPAVEPAAEPKTTAPRKRAKSARSAK